VCKTLDTNTKIKNYQMKTTHKNDKHTYHYLLNSGISQVRGGIQILREMEYPKEILDDLSQIDA
jgi:DNA mismatch repair ATPase MutS